MHDDQAAADGPGGDADAESDAGSDRVPGPSDASDERAGSDSEAASEITSPSNTAGESAGASRHDALSHHPATGAYNSIFHWTEARHPLRVMANYVAIVAARVCPSMRLKNWLLRRIGVTVGEGAAWGLESTPDVFWPELITVEDHAIVGYDATILCHEFLQDEYRTGEVVVGERAMIGAGAIVLPGVEIGAGARVAANSLVTEDVPPETTVAGVPATAVDD